MKRIFLVVAALLLALPMMGVVQTWDAAFELTPADGDLVSQGDDRIRDLKDTLAAEMETEHDFSTTCGACSGNDTGRHHLGSARPFFQAAAPANPNALVEADKAGFRTLDDARLWVDTDDSQLYFWDDTPTTDLATNELGAAGWASVWPLQFTVEGEATNDDQRGAVVRTREVITGVTAAIDVPDDGRSYEIVVTGLCSYSIDGGNMIGCWLVDDQDGDVDYKLAYSSDAGTEAGELTLSYTSTAPTNGLTYTYTIEFACTVALSADCVVNPEEGLGNTPVTADAFDAEEAMSKVTAQLRPRHTAY